MFSNQLFIQYWLDKKKDDAKIINIAGRQRMLSQRINLEFYKTPNNPSQNQQLSTLITEWRTAHEQLLLGSSELGTNPISNQSAIDSLRGLSPRISFIEAQLLLEHARLEKINTNQGHFLRKMNNTVKLLEQESDEKLRFIVWTEIVLMLITLIVIGLEIKYIYIPIFNQLKTAKAKLQKQNLALT